MQVARIVLCVGMVAIMPLKAMFGGCSGGVSRLCSSFIGAGGAESVSKQIVTEKVPIKSINRHLACLKREFPEAVMRRHIKDYKISEEEATRLRDEWIKYAVLVHTGNQLDMFSTGVDRIWHTFLLFNQDYERYCFRLDIHRRNRGILYHIPDEATYSGRKCKLFPRIAFIKAYNDMYGCKPDKVVWDALYSCSAGAVGCLDRLEQELKDE